MDAKRVGKTTIKMAASLIKHYAKTVVGEDALGIIFNAWTDAAGDSLDEKFENWLSEDKNKDDLLAAIQRADKCFRQEIANVPVLRDFRTMEPGEDDSVQKALAQLPKDADDTAVRQALNKGFRDVIRNLSADEYEQATTAYYRCLEQALIPLSNQTLGVIYRVVSRIEDRTSDHTEILKRIESLSLDLKDIIQEGFQRLEDQLAAPVLTQVAVPFLAPPLPPHFVPRSDVSQRLKDKLLANDVSPGVLQVSAIQGMPGSGKSTIAAALTYDEEIKNRYVDGVLWATLGQEPELLSKLSSWITALGDYGFHANSLDAATTHLRNNLQEKAILLVVDDVWESEHALPFRVGGTRSHLLITTRRSDVAEEIGAELHQLDVMTPKQSLNLLSAHLARSFEEQERDEALQLAKAVGYLPLALELAAARVARGKSWTALQEALNEEIARLEALDSPRRRQGGTRLEASFNLSLNALRAENEKAWQAFVWLGVLPEDVRIAAPMAVTLWMMDETSEANDVLELLWNEALILPTTQILVGNREWPAFRLHDLLHDSAIGLLTSPTDPQTANDVPGLGLTVPMAHTMFLKRYQPLTEDNQWHTLPNDGYIHTHLTWHMEKAEWVYAVHVLLSEETTFGKNGWFQANERLGQIETFLNDVARAWRLSLSDSKAEVTPPSDASIVELSTDNAEQPPDSSLGKQIRYALIQSSVYSLAGNIPPDLVRYLVEADIWKREVAISHISQISSPTRRSDTLAAVVHLLPERLKPEVLASILGNADNQTRTEMLITLMGREPTSWTTEVVQEAINMALSADYVDVWAKLITHAPDPYKLEVLAAVRRITDERNRAWVLSEMISHVADALKDEILTAIREIVDDWVRAETLSRVVEYLPAGQKNEVTREALTLIQGIDSVWVRANTLSMLVSNVPAEWRAEIVDEALAATDQMIDEQRQSYVRIVTRLLSYLPGTAPEALTVARRLADKWTRAEVLSSLVSYLPEDLRLKVTHEALDAAQTLEDDWDRAIALSAIVRSLQEPYRTEALNVVLNVDDQWDRVLVLSELASHLPEPLKTKVLENALTTAREMSNMGDRAEALGRLAGLLPEPLKSGVAQEALKAARGIDDDINRVQVITGLVTHLPQGLKGRVAREALTAAQEITDEWVRAPILNQLLSYLRTEEKPHIASEVLVTARKIDNEWDRAQVLTGLVVYLPDELKSTVTQEAIAAAQAIINKWDRVNTWSKVAIDIPAPHNAEVLSAARGTPDPWNRAYVLSNLLGHLPESLKADVAQEALAAAREITDERDQAEVLSELMGSAPDALKDAILTAVREIENEWDRATALSKVVENVPAGQKTEVAREAWNLTRSIDSVWMRAETLNVLVSNIPVEWQAEVASEAMAAAEQWKVEEQLTHAKVLVRLVGRLPEKVDIEVASEVLEMTRGIADSERRAKVLTRLTAQSPESLRIKVAREALAVTTEITNKRGRVQVLRELIGYLPSELQAEVLETMPQMRDWWEREQVFGVLVSHLPDESQEKALNLVRDINDELARAHALSELAPHLPEGLKEEALALAQGIPTDLFRAIALNGLAMHLPDELRLKVLSSAKAISKEDARAEALTRLVEYVPNDLRAEVVREALAAARDIDFEMSRAEALVELVPYVPDKQRAEVVSEALSAARDIGDGWVRGDVVEELVGQLSNSVKSEVLSEALAVAKGLRRESWRIHVYRSLLSHMPDQVDMGIVREIMSIARELTYERDRDRVFGELALKLSNERHDEALAAAREISNDHERAITLCKIASQLSGPLQAQVVHEVLAIVKEVTFYWNSRLAEELGDLTGQLSNELQAEVLAVTRETSNDLDRAITLSKIASQLPDPLQAKVVHEALNVAQGITFAWKRAEALSELLSQLSSEALIINVINQALTAAREITDEVGKAEVLIKLMGRVPDTQKHEVADEALMTVRSINDYSNRAKFLCNMVGDLPEELKADVVREILASLQAITSDNRYAKELLEIANFIPADYQAMLLPMVEIIRDEDERIQTLQNLLALVPSSLKDEVAHKALETVRHLDNPESQAAALAELASQLPDSLKVKALQVARAIPDRDQEPRALALSVLARHLSGDLKNEVINEALALLRGLPKDRWTIPAFSNLLGQVPDLLSAEIAQEALLAASQAHVLINHPVFLRRDVGSAFFSEDRADLFFQIVSDWKKLNYAGLGDDKEFWFNILGNLASLSRRELLTCLTALTPPIVHLDGVQAVRETLIAMHDVSRWWP